MSTAGEALMKVNEFDARSTGTTWRRIKKDQLIDGMKKRLKDPDLISTEVVNLCGPGALFRCLAEDDPVMYVQAIISLYETNSAKLGGRDFTAGSSLQAADPATDMDHVDWILLASLRDHENLILNYDTASGTLSGLTMPIGMAKWFGQARYTQVTNNTNVFFTKNVAHIKQAGSLHASGNRVCLLVNSQMLKVATNTHRSVFPNHWVVLMSNVTVDAQKNIRMDVHSWGAIYTIPAQGTLAADKFCRNYYGYVSARHP